MLVSWVGGDADLRWLAPNTAPPLTPEKVLEWQKPEGRAYVAVAARPEEPNGSPPPRAMHNGDCGESDLVAYGELNPIQGRPRQFWLGHCLVRPDRRGRGLGCAFVKTLLRQAFAVLRASNVALIVFPDNRAALHCYLRAGFVAVGEEWHSFLSAPPERLLRLEARPGAPV
jgi:RimJ/RimL family protein N-acetyltransferase